MSRRHSDAVDNMKHAPEKLEFTRYGNLAYVDEVLMFAKHFALIYLHDMKWSACNGDYDLRHFHFCKTFPDMALTLCLPVSSWNRRV